MTDSHLKIDYLNQYAKGEIFVETGTYMGDTVRLAKQYGFKTIHSIELNDELYEKNKRDFADDISIKLWHGDSVECMPRILDTIHDEATFWLDAHASGPLVGGQYGPCPLELELRAIAGKELLKLVQGQMKRMIDRRPINTHTIFIDDRRLMGTQEWGGVSEQTILNVLKFINPDYKIIYLDGHIPNDVICATVK